MEELDNCPYCPYWKSGAGCVKLDNVEPNHCDFHYVGSSDEMGLENCRAACSADPNCFAIQWHEGEDWCDKCTGDSGHGERSRLQLVFN